MYFPLGKHELYTRMQVVCAYTGHTIKKGRPGLTGTPSILLILLVFYLT